MEEELYTIEELAGILSLVNSPEEEDRKKAEQYFYNRKSHGNLGNFLFQLFSIFEDGYTDETLLIVTQAAIMFQQL